MSDPIIPKAVSKKVSFLTGEYLITEKSHKKSLFIVQKGKVLVFKSSLRQELFPLGTVGPGEYLGENSLLFGTPHSASAVALTDVECIEIPFHLIEEQLEKAPAWLVSLTRGVIQRLNRANDLVKRNNLVDDSLKEIMKDVKG